MAKITLFSAVTLDNAAEGPFTLKIWPPESLESTLRGYHRRHLQQRGWVNMAGEIPAKVRAAHHRGRPKGGGLRQFSEGINQKDNTGKR